MAKIGFEYDISVPRSTIVISNFSRPLEAGDVESILKKIEYWHQAPITKFRIFVETPQSERFEVHWDGERATEVAPPPTS
jgi:hypothetical protein